MKKIVLLLIAAFAYCCALAGSDNATTNDEFIKLSREFITNIKDGKYDLASENFAPMMKKGFTNDKMAQVWQTMIFQYGSMKAFADGATVNATQGYHTVLLPVKFERADVSFRVSFDSLNKIAGFFVADVKKTTAYNPPPYVKKDSFSEQDVKVGNSSMPLSGTLTLPKGKGPFPAVVLVHGSGPNDRDESIGPNMPFRDLAWGLASKGIAVLRYEKRTKEYGEQVVKAIDSLTINEETVNDAVDAAEMLSKNPSIKPDKIFILGHSLGAMSAPRIGSRFKNSAGLIIMAGTDRQLQDLYLEQIEYLMSLEGKPDTATQEKINSIKEQVSLVNSDRLNRSTPRDSLPMNLPAKYWLELKSYSPAATLMSLSIPALIMQGERDYQVDMKSYKRWQEKLAGRKNTDFKLYPKLNHLFIEGEGKPSPGEYQKESHIPDYVINDIYTWVSSK